MPKRKAAPFAVMELRRERVARLLLRNLTQREIVLALAEDENYRVLNPQTGAPFSLGTINKDIQTLKQVWQTRAFRTYDEYLSENLAKLDEVERQAWATGNLPVVLAVIEKRSRLIGLDAPQKVEVESRWQNEVIELILGGKITFDFLKEEMGYSEARKLFIAAGREPDEDVSEGMVIELQADPFEKALIERYRNNDITLNELERLLDNDELVRRIIES